MSNDQDLLLRIQQLQFKSRGEAEALLLDFIQQTFPQLEVEHVQLRPLATSLNSFNGFLRTADGTRLFFKTHTEQDNAISEYYNAEMLEQAGYPVVKPLYSSTNAGQQLLIYPLIESPAVFDLARAVETGQTSAVSLEALTAAQNASDRKLTDIYAHTLEWQEAEQAAKAPVHQLFYHRLMGGRLDRFYSDSQAFPLPQYDVSWSELKRKHWVINGISYHTALAVLIDEAITLLRPDQAGPSVIGHGDAHNGNVFYEGPSLRYFDPAFAGRHHPLLDVVKPIFHNVFAMWMYFREQEREKLSITLEMQGDVWHVTHDYRLNPVRQMFLNSKFKLTVAPLLRLLHANGWLDPHWRRQAKLALMCCPLLTMNLTTFPPEIALLGLSFCVEMGAESDGTRSIIDMMLDAAAAEAGVTD